MAKVTGSKTTKAAEAASLKKARTQHHVGIGQVMAQPNARAAREEAKRVLAEALEAGVDGREPQTLAEQQSVALEGERERQAMDFIRPTAPYNPTSSIDAPVRRLPEPVEPLKNMGNGWMVRLGPAFVTQKQAKWMISIANRPSVTDAMRESLKLRLEQGFSRKAGSDFITKYKDIPTEAATDAMVEATAPGATNEEVVRPVTADVPNGRFALRGEDGVLKFYQVSHGKGRWEGYTFVRVQASDDTYNIRNKAERERILGEIAVDVLAAEQLYGQELGKCSRCGRTLTDETSRAYGIGPDCRSK